MKKGITFLILAVAGLAIGFNLKANQNTDPSYIPMTITTPSQQSILPSHGGGSCGS